MGLSGITYTLTFVAMVLFVPCRVISLAVVALLTIIRAQKFAAEQVWFFLIIQMENQDAVDRLPTTHFKRLAAMVLSTRFV